jgi:uncharacterized Fe-S center protein
MVAKAPALNESIIRQRYPDEQLENCDKFQLLHPDTNWQAGLEYAEKIGLGTRNYQLKIV